MFKKMRNLNKNELMQINGGAVSAAFINALSRAASTLLNLGQIVGTTIRRFFSKKYC